MPTITCNLRSFTAVARSSPIHLNLSMTQLIHCAITVGIPTLSTHTIQPRPLTEMLWRAAIVSSNLHVTNNNSHWTRSTAYDNLDPSEKSAVSYFLGMTQAALTTRHALGYGHLVHVDLLLQHQGTTLKGTRPDFVAVDVNPTHATMYSAVVEAKGRTNGFDQKALRDAKHQVQHTPGLRGLAPREKIASLAYFDGRGNWSSTLEDPEGTYSELSFGIENYLLVYYRHIIEAAQGSRRITETDDYLRYELPELPIAVSVPMQIVKAYEASAKLESNEERDQIRPLFHAYNDFRRTPRPEVGFTGADHINVENID